MRILCITSWFPPHHFGGYELSCHDVMVRLGERGHHVEVLTSDHRHEGVDDGGPEALAAVHRDLVLYHRDGRLWAPSLPGRVRVERANQRALRAALARSRPDIVAVWHVGAMSLGVLTTVVSSGVPVVSAVSDDWPVYAPRLDAWYRAVRRAPRALGAVGAIARVPTALPDLDAAGPWCFISEITRQRCRRSPWRFPLDSVVHSGIDGRLFDHQSIVDRRDPDPDRLRLLFVGRVDERKGVATVVRALAALPGASLTIDGRASGDERRMLERWTSEAGVSDRVTLQCSERSDLPAVYAAADVCVFASEWEEPFGLVPLEAMACGTPVVATNMGGSAEFLVDGGNVVRFEPASPGSLADALRRVAMDTDLRHRLVTNGRASAAHFDVDHLTDRFESWYAATAAGRPDQGPGEPAPLVLPLRPSDG